MTAHSHSPWLFQGNEVEVASLEYYTARATEERWTEEQLLREGRGRRRAREGEGEEPASKLRKGCSPTRPALSAVPSLLRNVANENMNVMNEAARQSARMRAVDRDRREAGMR